MSNRVAVVTGAARGMGRAHAFALARAGWALALIDLDGGGLHATLEQSWKAGVKARAYEGDVRDANFLGASLSDVTAWGTPLGLVNNAGIGSASKPFEELSRAEFQEMYEVHVLGSVACIQAVLPFMRSAHFGRIVNISSYCALAGSVGYAHYCAAKAALIGVTRSLAVEVATEGITVNAVAPGLVETEMTASDTKEQRAKALSEIPMGRYGQPFELAATVEFLCSEEAGFVTGQVFSIDGGMVMA